MRNVLELRYLGDDRCGRKVFEDQNGTIWKNTEVFIGRTTRLCTALGNQFDGEPDTPIQYISKYKDAEIIFLPVAEGGETQ